MKFRGALGLLDKAMFFCVEYIDPLNAEGNLARHVRTSLSNNPDLKFSPFNFSLPCE